MSFKSYYKTTLINTLAYRWNDGSAGIDLHMYGHLICDKNASAILGKKGWSFHVMVMKQLEPWHLLHIITNIGMRWNRVLNEKQKQKRPCLEAGKDFSTGHTQKILINTGKND